MKRFAAWLVTAAAALSPTAAFPCGGFFCSGGPNNPPPVIQTGENILFGFETGGEVTAHVQINYSGEPRAFAWIVPVPAVPTLSVGSDQLFTLLDQGSTPTFAARFTNGCTQPASFGCGAGGVALQSGTQDAGSTGGVTVISQAPVGPFETAILSTTNPKSLQEWLVANGFDVSPATDALIAPYAAKGDYFVALKLQSNKSVGDLQPIVLKYKSTEGPCVPIRLTAAAAMPDMGVRVYLLGPSRAVPVNYLHLVLNEARINWVTRGSNYQSVVSAAADEAGGRGFVTDYAGSNAPVRQPLSAALARYNRSTLDATTPDAFVRAVRATGFLGTSQNVLALLQRCVPIPASVTTAPFNFYNFWESFQSQVTQTTVEQPKCGDDFDTLVVEPLRSADAMMGRLPILTRLFTTMSASEMTLDPIFVLNPDLPEVPAARVLNAELECNSSGQPVRATFTGSDGARFNVPFGGTLADAPALLRAEKLSERGAPVVMLDNTARAKDLNRSTIGMGCMVAGGGSLVAMGMAALILLARRRRLAR